MVDGVLALKFVGGIICVCYVWSLVILC